LQRATPIRASQIAETNYDSPIKEGLVCHCECECPTSA
jgi:hypothetical protein